MVQPLNLNKKNWANFHQWAFLLTGKKKIKNENWLLVMAMMCHKVNNDGFQVTGNFSSQTNLNHRPSRADCLMWAAWHSHSFLDTQAVGERHSTIYHYWKEERSSSSFKLKSAPIFNLHGGRPIDLFSSPVTGIWMDKWLVNSWEQGSIFRGNWGGKNSKFPSSDSEDP